MKEVKLRSVLTYLTDFARFLTVYPLLLFWFSGVLKRTETPAVPCTALTIVMAFFCLTVSLLVARKVERNLPLRIAQAVAVLVSAAVGAVACSALGGSVMMCVFAGMMFGVYGVLGCVSATFSLKKFEFFAAAAVYLFVVVVLNWRGFGYPVRAFLIQFVVICSIYALELNFQNIDFLMRRRGHQMSHLPGRIRSFNLLLLAGGLVLVVLLVLSRGFFMNVAGTVIRALLGVIAFVFTPLRRWWKNIPDAGRPIDIPMLEADEDPVNAFEQLVGEEEETVVNVDLQINILIVLGVGLVIFCLIYFRKYIAEWLRAIGNWISDQLNKLFRGVHRKKRFDFDENMYFTDEEEHIDGSTTTLGSFGELRAWRKDLKAFQKQPDSREKFLSGWVLTVRGLQLHGVAVSRSDTPREILAKAEKILDPKGYAVATQCCNALAFSLHEPTPAWPELQQALETLRSRKMEK